ncbi:MAG: hypothetical protein AB2A00_26120 [Myxococcota bacterium]
MDGTPPPTDVTTPPQAPPAPEPAVGPLARVGAVAWGLALLLVLLNPVCTRDAAATDSALDAVAAKVREGNGRAFVLVHPPWRDDVMNALLPRLPGWDVGLALPPDAMDGKRPVIAVLWPSAPDPGALWRAGVDREDVVEGVRVRFHVGAGQRAEAAAPAAEAPSGATDLRTRLKDARVQVQGGARTVECNAWDARAQRWNCPGMDEWNFVGPRELPVGGAGRSCIWAHPVTDATLSITFPSVALGRALRLGHGLADGAAGLEGAADVNVRLTAGAASRSVVHANAPGWVEDKLETAAGSTSDVVVEVTTDHDGARHFCITLVVEP